MKSFLLMSIVLAGIAVPAIAARARQPRRGLVLMLLWLLVANVTYVAYITLLHPVLFVPHWP